MKIIAVLMFVFALLFMNGCGSSQPSIKQEEKKPVVKTVKKELSLEEKKKKMQYDDCMKGCDKLPKNLGLFKDGFSHPIEYDLIYDLNKKNLLMIRASQGTEFGTPTVEMFFKQVDWVNKIYFTGNGLKGYLAKVLKEIKTDWSKIPNGSNKKYEHYYNSAQGFVKPILYNKDDFKFVLIVIIGKHSVHKVYMSFDEKGLSEIIDTLNDLEDKLTNKHVACTINCKEKY